MSYFSDWEKEKDNIVYFKEEYIVNEEDYKSLDKNKKRVELLREKVNKLEIKKAALLEEEALSKFDVSVFDNIYVTKDNSCIFSLSTLKVVDEEDIAKDAITVDLHTSKRYTKNVCVGYDSENDKIYSFKYEFFIDSTKKKLEKKFISYRSVPSDDSYIYNCLLKKVLKIKYDIDYNGSLTYPIILNAINHNANTAELMRSGVRDWVISNIDRIELLKRFKDVKVSVLQCFGMSQSDYLTLAKSGYLNEVLYYLFLNNVDYSSVVRRTDTNEIIKGLEHLESKRDDFKFYEIRSCGYTIVNTTGEFEEGTSYSYFALWGYFSSIISSKMSFYDFVIKSVDTTLNQGYRTYKMAIDDIMEYLATSDGFGFEANTNFSQLKHAINVIKRNYSYANNESLEEYYKNYNEGFFNGYFIVFPKDVNDLKFDGSALSYSMATELSDIENGDALTVFLREDEKTPFIKFTLNKNKISNIKCIYDNEIEEDQYNAIVEWKNSIN